MTDSQPTKSDITAIFKRLKSIPANKQCFDCCASNPTWASVTYGVFLCIDCSAVHRSLGVHVTFIRSIQLDTNWTWLQLRAMQVGGNAAAKEFFQRHNCTTNDAQQKYSSRAAQLYREKLHSSAMKALKLHGSKLHIDSAPVEASSLPAGDTHVDFFEHHESNNLENNSACNLAPGPVAAPIAINSSGNLRELDPIDPGAGPNVEAALSMSPTSVVHLTESRVPIIGTRKPAASKKTLGGKKGLGAQKVNKNFGEIESEALRKETEREQTLAAQAAQQKLTVEEEEKKMANLKLAYQDLSVDQKKREETMKNLDPKKREQMERLGMGATGNRGVSHSVMTDMETIKQENPASAPKVFNMDSYLSRTGGSRAPADDFELITSGSARSGPPKYYDNPFGMKPSSSKSSFDRLDDNSYSANDEDISSSSKESDKDRSRSRKGFDVSDVSNDAQKKFGNAKAISSDQYFGRNDPDSELKSRLSKYEGSSSISSADLFGSGDEVRSRQRPNYYDNNPDLSDFKEGVKQVAGRLSNLANGVFTSIQDNYG